APLLHRHRRRTPRPSCRAPGPARVVGRPRIDAGGAMNPQPPLWAERMLARAVAGSPYADDIVGDLHEAFIARAAGSALLARSWYCVEALRLAAPFPLPRRPPR